MTDHTTTDKYKKEKAACGHSLDAQMPIHASLTKCICGMYNLSFEEINTMMGVSTTDTKGKQT